MLNQRQKTKNNIFNDVQCLTQSRSQKIMKNWQIFTNQRTGFVPQLHIQKKRFFLFCNARFFNEVSSFHISTLSKAPITPLNGVIIDGLQGRDMQD